MQLSVCGLTCDECEHFGNRCKGCRQVNGQTFWALEMMPNKTCPLADCAQHQRGYYSCGECAELPCATFREMKDPAATEQEHAEALVRRVELLIAEAEYDQ